MNRCVIVGSAPVEDPDRLKDLIRKDDVIFCADGGFETALRMGVRPSFIAGDFDSFAGDLPEDIEVIRLPECKDDTDLMFCVKEALRRGFNDVLLLGATGGRMDHTIGNLGILLYLARRNAGNLMADAYNQAFVAQEGAYMITGKKGDMVSVFPYGCNQCCVSYEGLAYPLHHGTLNAEEPVGVSNRLTQEKAVITVHSGPVLVVKSKE
ncbi:MAG: thiamine diphosphokinase [Clostridiales bacterium]|jgi:thiamine pyrophosphokinase|nr:thiamine diphosphokinase [Clostridiales bacterium]